MVPTIAIGPSAHPPIGQIWPSGGNNEHALSKPRYDTMISKSVPSHTSARLIKLLVPSKSHVIEYQPVMHLQCSADLIGKFAY